MFPKAGTWNCCLFMLFATEFILFTFYLKKRESKKKHKSHKDHVSNDTGKKRHEEVTEQKVKERDKDHNRMHKKIPISSDEASRDR